jgi:hypothetical protein
VHPEDHDSHFSSKIFPGVLPPLHLKVMNNTRSDRSELTSINQLVHDIIDGGTRRHTFTQWELELLLDLQTCRIRKSSRPEVLRRYLKAVQQHFAAGALDPLRLATFLEQENQRSRPAEAQPWTSSAAESVA